MIDEETVKKVLDVLRDEVSEMPKNWNRRFKHNRDKIKTGDIYELAEVVRNLSLRESEKGLSTGEKQMFTRTKKILASELMYALDKDEEEAESYLDELLADSASSQMAGARPSTGSRARSSRSCRVRDSATMAIALIVAAGRGERLGADRPKALVELAGRPMLQWSSTRCAPRGDRADRRGAAARVRGARPGRSACRGRRALGLGALARSRPPAPGDPVLVHDAARPLLTPSDRARRSRRWSATRLRRGDRRGAGHRHDQARRRAARCSRRSTAAACGRFRRRRSSAARR